jgi:dihydrofolate synthase/folylpolyglutamate synthase
MQNIYLESYSLLENELNKLIPPKKFSKDINMRLERITHLLTILGNPQEAFRSIHVGGTSGKGSTSVMISSIFSAAGYRTGLHLSPHLQILNERFQIDNHMVSTSVLAKLYEEIKPAVIEVASTNPFGQPSYFEVQTAMSFCLFRQEQVDVAIIEVGLGGELDATNVLKSDVAVITNVGLDHTEILGNTVEEIAVDKSGIIKSGQIIISGVTQNTVREIIRKKTLKERATLWQIGTEISIVHKPNNVIDVICPEVTYSNLRLGLYGDFQFTNAACAVAAVNAFAKDIPVEAVTYGLSKAFIPGRFEVVQRHPLIVLDGAHNPDKMSALVRGLNESFSSKRKIFVLSIKDGKDYSDILRILLEGYPDAFVILTAFDIKGLWAPVPPRLLADKISEMLPLLKVEIIENPMDALKHAIEVAGENDMIIATGSLYMIGDIRNLWYPVEKLLEGAEN